MIDSKLPDIGTTIFSIMSTLANNYGAINLSQGFPNFPIDARLKQMIKKALDAEQVQYAPMPGRMDLRQQLSAKMHIQHDVIIDPNTEITITAGATQAIYSIIATTVSAGEEVILFDPAYDCYDPAIRLHGGVPKHLNLSFPDFRINWNEVYDVVDDSTRMIILNNPHNPAGTVWVQEDMRRLEALCLKHPDLLILSDEVYEHMQYEGIHQSIIASKILRSRSFVVYSFGKTFHVTGWKIGYCVAPVALTSELRKVHQFNVFCVNNTMQAALSEYLSSGDEWREVANFYRLKRDLFIDGMKQSRFKALNCDGTYFCLFDYSEISDLPDAQFAEWMTKKHKVASIPISIFYDDRTDNKVVRFCFAKEEETLTDALLHLCKI